MESGLQEPLHSTSLFHHDRRQIPLKTRPNPAAFPPCFRRLGHQDPMERARSAKPVSCSEDWL